VPREVTTTEALMTDPTTPEGRAYWRQRHDYEAALERDADDYDDWDWMDQEADHDR
jgi:hypothetical protein